MNKEEITKENKRITINLPRKYGKMTFGLQQFYAGCKNKKRVVLRMPEGDIYSPEALKDLLQSQKQDLLEKIEKEFPTPKNLKKGEEILIRKSNLIDLLIKL